MLIVEDMEGVCRLWVVIFYVASVSAYADTDATSYYTKFHENLTSGRKLRVLVHSRLHVKCDSYCTSFHEMRHSFVTSYYTKFRENLTVSSPKLRPGRTNRHVFHTMCFCLHRKRSLEKPPLRSRWYVKVRPPSFQFKCLQPYLSGLPHSHPPLI